ncbi:EF-hand domain-containing protein [Methylomonas sp. 2BW1-5-20]|uniref:EF-hand domain-containing protein n=1 Tax=Methylomonas sp. 2BW1-5-20 TaxID=3376686 RepID=UPI00405088FA
MKTNKTKISASNNGNPYIKIIQMSLMLGLGVIAIINPVSAEQSQIKPVAKSADGKGKLPTFAQADINGDHLVTKSELQNFPYMLQTFDKVDAGNDGKLEQHEYQNLKMETKREGEVK